MRLFPVLLLLTLAFVTACAGEAAEGNTPAECAKLAETFRESYSRDYNVLYGTDCKASIYSSHQHYLANEMYSACINHAGSCAGGAETCCLKEWNTYVSAYGPVYENMKKLMDESFDFNGYKELAEDVKAALEESENSGTYCREVCNKKFKGYKDQEDCCRKERDARREKWEEAKRLLGEFMKKQPQIPGSAEFNELTTKYEKSRSDADYKKYYEAFNKQADTVKDILGKDVKSKPEYERFETAGKKYMDCVLGKISLVKPEGVCNNNGGCEPGYGENCLNCAGDCLCAHGEACYPDYYVTDDKGCVAPEKRDCENFGVTASEYDLYYDREMITTQLTDLIYAGLEDGSIDTASADIEGYDPLLYKDLVWSHLRDHTMQEGHDIAYINRMKAKFYTEKEIALRLAIEWRFKESGERLMPSDVLRESLALNDNNLYDAMLTCHNVLRAAGRGMEDFELVNADGTNYKHKEYVEWQVTDSGGSQIKGGNSDPAFFDLVVPLRDEDNSGAWYHLFGTMVAGYAESENVWSGSKVSELGIWFEHKVYKEWMKSRYDPGEHCWDTWGVSIGKDIYSRVNRERIRQRIDAKDLAERIRGAEPRTITVGFMQIPE